MLLSVLVALLACGIEPSPTLAEKLQKKMDEGAEAPASTPAPTAPVEVVPVHASLQGVEVGVPHDGEGKIEVKPGVYVTVRDGIVKAVSSTNGAPSGCDGADWSTAVAAISLERVCFKSHVFHSFGRAGSLAVLVDSDDDWAKVEEKLRESFIPHDWRTNPWIGDPIDIRSVRYTVTSINCNGEVLYTVENMGNRTTTALPSVSIRDTQGRVFDPASEATLRRAAALKLDWLASQLQPGMPKNQVAVFETPPGALDRFDLMVGETPVPFACPGGK